MLVPYGSGKVETCSKIIVYDASMEITLLTEPNNKNCVTYDIKLGYNIFSCFWETGTFNLCSLTFGHTKRYLIILVIIYDY